MLTVCHSNQLKLFHRWNRIPAEDREKSKAKVIFSMNIAASDFHFKDFIGANTNNAVTAAENIQAMS